MRVEHLGDRLIHHLRLLGAIAPAVEGEQVAIETPGIPLPEAGEGW